MFTLFKYSQAKLAKEVIAICADIDPETDYQYDPSKQVVNSQQRQIYLGNLFNVIKDKNKQERLMHLSSFLRSALFTEPLSYDSHAQFLVPRIKTRTEYGIMAAACLRKEQKDHVLHFELTPRFVVLLAVDGETSVQTIKQTDLAKLELTAEQAYKYALANLYRLGDGPFTMIEKGIYQSRFKDDHDAARILMSDEIAQLSLDSPPLVFIPTTTCLVICGVDDTEALVKVCKISLQIAARKRPLSQYPLLLKDGQWQDFTPPRTPSYAPAYNLSLVEQTADYGNQKMQLEAYDKAANVEFFLAVHTIFELPDGIFYSSICIWVQGVRSWLPKVETVHFVETVNHSAGESLGKLPWDTVMAEFGDYLTPLGLYPERYEVKGFPDRARVIELVGRL